MKNKTRKNLSEIFKEEKKVFKYNNFEDFVKRCDWKRLCSLYHLCEDTCFDFQKQIDWDLIIENESIHDDVLLTFQHLINWEKAIEKRHLSQDFIDKIEKAFINSTNNNDPTLHDIWFNIYCDERQYAITDTSFANFKLNPNWNRVCSYYKLSTEFIEKYIDYISWERISANVNITIKQLLKYKEHISWWFIFSSYRDKSGVFGKIDVKTIKLIYPNNSEIICAIQNNDLRLSVYKKTDDLSLEVGDHIYLQNQLVYKYHADVGYTYVIVEIEPVDHNHYDYIIYLENS